MSKNFNLFNRTSTEVVAVIDSRFPRPEPFGFKNTEINEFFKLTDYINSYTMHPMRPGKKAWFTHGYGISRKEFRNNKKGYLRYYPENKKRIKYLYPNKRYNFKLAYSYFLAETYTLLPFYEKFKIPFVFVLYPGGGFGINNLSSDNMLKAIFSSRYFKKVITTKNITKNYLYEKKLCYDKDIVEMRGYVQFGDDIKVNKKLYKENKKTFDICFVSAKYSERGTAKGYDVFIEVAKKIVKKFPNIHFHVVGGFDENEIDVSEIRENIHFYGFKRPDFLKVFYESMDILLSPNKPDVLYKGSFDGFPLGADASSMGVGLLVTDDLNQNTYYDDNEIEIINHNPEDIAESVEYYYLNPMKLYEMSKRGQVKTREMFDKNIQVENRIKLFDEILKETYGHNIYRL